MTKLYVYQIKGVRAAKGFEQEHLGGIRAYLGDEMGLGKTIQALTVCQRYIDFSKGPVIIICPASVKWEWQNQIKQHLGMRSEVLEGQAPWYGNRIEVPPFLIVNYDILRQRRVKGVIPKKKDWVKALRRLNPQAALIDESHYLANSLTRRTLAVSALCSKIPNILCLSGTAFSSRPIQLYPALNLLRPDVFDGKMPFGERYCGPRTEYGRRTYKGSSNEAELAELLRETCLIRRLKKDVIKELPKKSRHVVTLDMTPEARKDYRHVLRDFKSWMIANRPDRLKGKDKANAKIAQIAKLNYLRQIIGRGKLPAVFEWIDSFLASSSEKLIVFAHHKSVVKALAERYANICTKIDGSVTGHKRQLARDRFQTSPRCRLLVGNIKAAGTGLNLTAASTVVFVEYGWTPGEHVQAEDRCYARIGDMHGANAFWLVCADTMEIPLVAMLQDKHQTFSAIMDGDRLATPFDVYDRLTKELLKGAA